MEMNVEGLQKQKWNVPTARANKGGEKNGVICLAIMFTKVIVIKMSKMALSYIFRVWQQKISHGLGKTFNMHLKDFI